MDICVFVQQIWLSRWTEAQKPGLLNAFPWPIALHTERSELPLGSFLRRGGPICTNWSWEYDGCGFGVPGNESGE